MILAHGAFYKLISRFLSLNVKIGNENLGDENGLIRKQLVYAFQPFFLELDACVDLLLGHGFFP